MAVCSMRVGEVASVTCSPSYAFGAVGRPPLVPADATVQWHVELLHVDHKVRRRLDSQEAMGGCLHNIWEGRRERASSSSFPVYSYSCGGKLKSTSRQTAQHSDVCVALRLCPTSDEDQLTTRHGCLHVQLCAHNSWDGRYSKTSVYSITVALNFSRDCQ